MSLRKTYTSIFLSSFIIFSVSLLPFSYATDTLTPGQTLKDGQTLVSAQEAFELGFFSPGNSSYRYVGIWYHNISILTVVWVANRGSPLTDSTGSLALIGDGNIVVRDGRGNTLWSTNSSSTSSNPMAQLLDSGNLVVNRSDGTRSWQSFDHPTDTFIPGMTLSLNRRTGKNQLFTSWKSPNDPSIGNYSLGLDPEGSAQVFMWEGSVLRWRSGQWDGQTFIGTMMRSLYLYGFKLTNDVGSGIMSFVFEPYNSTLLRFVMQYDGVENTSMLLGEPSQWQEVWVQPLNDCEIYGKCGKYGWCSPSSSPICSCLKGFEPSSSQEWNNGNWSGGCVRRTQLACELNASATAGDGDGFSRLEGVKLPDHSDWATTVRDPVGCESFCLNNCSCKAYAYVPTIGCLTWGRDLIDIYQFSQGGNDLFVKLAASEFGGNSRIWIAIVIPISGAVFILIACLLLWRRYSVKVKDWWKCRRREDISRTLPSSRDVIPDISVPSEVGGEEQEVKGSELPLFSFETLATATSDFSESNKLGRGGFGHVYKGELPGGEVIAVKRLSTSSGQGMQEFKNEVMLIAKLQHRNLVKLLGCCIEGEEKMLIYEYMPNKSLDALLFDPSKQELLDWKKRFNIIEAIARGLLYLHQDSRLRVVHRDLKASNILLDENLNPKISDFGMARIFGGDQNQENTNRVVGTFGYMSPEYAMEGIFSVKSDVYSFGVLILEIVTGRKNNSFHHLENSSTIVGHAWSMWNGGKSMELVDPSLRSSCSTRQVLRCIHVGLLCVQDRPSDRPEISSVLLMLGGENAILRMPKQPTFISERDPNETATLSTNDVTITILSGR